MKKQSARFYFSFRSPYSWIAARLLEERFNQGQNGLEYIPFWEPDKQTLSLLKARGGRFLYSPMNREKHLYLLQDIKRLASNLGYGIAWPIDIDPWWDLPHLAYLAARHQGKAHQFFWRVYQTRWEEAADICCVGTIRRLADEIGLNSDVVVGAPNDPTIRKEGAEALYQAYLDGVFGVPFFIKGYEKFYGVDRLKAFAAVFTGQPDASRDFPSVI